MEVIQQLFNEFYWFVFLREFKCRSNFDGFLLSFDKVFLTNYTLQIMENNGKSIMKICITVYSVFVLFLSLRDVGGSYKLF